MSAPTIAAVIEEAAYQSGLCVADITGRSMSRNSVIPARQLAMCLARELTGRSYTALGRAFGNRDHSTVIYGRSIAIRRMQSDTDYAEKADRIRQAVLA